MNLHQKYQHNIRVYTEDVDYMGIVYHSNYLCYFERARTEMLRQKGMLLSGLAGLNVYFAITEIGIRYKSPAKLDDLLTVSTSIIELKKCTFVFEQKMNNQNEQLISEAEIKVVCVDEDLKPKRVPEFLYQDFDTGDKK